MAFADPQSIKISGSEISLPRTSTSGNKSAYESADGLTKLTISTEKSRRKRHVYRVDVEKSVSDPMVPANNTVASMSTYIVIDRPLFGYDNTAALAVVAGLLEAATASSSADLVKLLGSES